MSLDARKRRFIEALMTSPSIKEACKKANISRASATRYEKDSEFQAAYHKLQQQAMEFTGNKLRSITNKAADTLIKVLDDPEATPTEKTRAAKIILDSAFNVQETQDILQRLDNLESEVANE